MKKHAIGSNIKKLREEIGLTQTELSKQAGIERPYLSRIENDPKANPSSILIANLSKALGVQMEVIVLGKEVDYHRQAVEQLNKVEEELTKIRKQMIPQ